MAGNQLGKTFSGGAEVVYHLTGNYPDWWQGKRFDRPTVWLAGSVSFELTRDGVQRILLGNPMAPETWGQGLTPKDTIIKIKKRGGSVVNAVESISIRHKSGGISTINFKAYEQGREKWQANTVDGIWFDEEPPEPIYTEGITRTNATQGPVIVTFTPLKGMSEVVQRFLGDLGAKHADRNVTIMTIFEVDHYTPEQRQQIINSYPAHEREARINGTPTFGSGLVFQVDEVDITVSPFIIPDHWRRIGGMDFGFDHPFAGVELAIDDEQDIIYLTKEYRKRQSPPVIHCAALKPWGDWLPWAWPHDGLQKNKDTSGKEFKELYAMEGLNMLAEKATHPPTSHDEKNGGNGVEAGLIDMFQRMQTGRWKVFSTCTGWLSERRLYHRKEGVVVKEVDDLISASRYAYMMRRFAITKPAPYVAPKIDTDWVV